MSDDLEEQTPKVFISYSHDSTEHKAWVAELATKLRENGVDVRLDRWDLRRGDDIAKFMERSVAWADRVLMICNGIYVRKADDGTGGVGYEAMIVTDELVRDLGSAKFIPIIRQASDKSDLPKFMATRFYVNLSTDDGFQENFDELLRELHNETALKKPPLGKNPFAKTPAGTELPKNPKSAKKITVRTVTLKNQMFTRASEIARTGDIGEWRRLINNVRPSIPNSLLEWRQRWEKGALSADQLMPMCIEGIRCYEPLIAIALAGVESGREAMRNQISVVDLMLAPKGWSRAGLTVIGDFPFTATFAFQALHGAVCVETQQLDLAINLAKTRVLQPNSSERVDPLFRNRELVGWSPSFVENLHESWNSYVKCQKLSHGY